MTCIFPQELTFRQLPDISATNANHPKVIDLTQKISAVRLLASRLPPSYEVNCFVRVALILATIALIFIGILALSGKLVAITQQFVQFFQTANWTHIGIGVAAFAVLSCGAAFVIRRSLKTRDPVIDFTCGDLQGNAHWIAAGYISENKSYVPCYIDKSTLDANRTGKAYMYAYKDEKEHMSVAISVFAVAPLHMIGAIVYNVLRLVIVPFFILVCMLVEYLREGKALFSDDRGYEFSDIPKEIGYSLWRIVKAPFFCVAFMFAAIYAFFDPLNGRKLGACIERQWNEGVTRAEGFWSVRGPQSLFLFEGGGSPSRLGRNGYYLAGCWQPMAVVTYRENKIIATCSLSKAINPEKGNVYGGFSAEGLVELHDNYVSDLEAFSQQAIS